MIDSPFLPLEINTPVFDVLQRFVMILNDDGPAMLRYEHCSTRPLQKKESGSRKHSPNNVKNLSYTNFSFFVCTIVCKIG